MTHEKKRARAWLEAEGYEPLAWPVESLAAQFAEVAAEEYVESWGASAREGRDDQTKQGETIMTMQIRIENRDSTRTAVVTQTSGPRNDPSKQSVARTEIKPLQSADFWLHSHQWVEVTELQETPGG